VMAFQLNPASIDELARAAWGFPPPIHIRRHVMVTTHICTAIEPGYIALCWQITTALYYIEDTND